jgi:rhodanese-related sulfurtransferase
MIMERNLTADEFEDFVNEKESILLDVRESYEYSESHLEKSKLVPSSNFWAHFEELHLAKDDRIALYCHTGSRSMGVINALLEAGYLNVVHLERGIIDWHGQGKKLVR